MSAKKLNDTTVRTGKVRLAFAKIWKPEPQDNGDLKYSATLLIPKKDKLTLKLMAEAIEAAKTSGVSKKWGGKMPKNVSIPIRDGDEDKPERDEFAGMMFINVKSTTKPTIVDQSREQIYDEAEVHSGTYVSAIISAFPYENKGKTGVSFGLEMLQKLEDGESLAGARISVDAAFGDDESLD